MGNTNERSKYEAIKTLGEGASCSVYLVKEKKTKQLYALKVMKKTAKESKTLFQNEAKILQLLKHPNILEYVTSFEDAKTYNILTVLCRGGELFDRVSKGRFTEKVAAHLTKQMLLAVNCCHKNNVVHRDLKPENFVFDSDAEDSNMKLIDFGCAKIVKDTELIRDVAGSPYYAAPCVLLEEYRDKRTGAVWKMCDMWSIGVIVFMLVCGYPPFNGRNQDAIFEKIKKGKFKFPSRPAGEPGLSEEVKDLITRLLTMDPKQQLTVEKALEHPWVTGKAQDIEIPASVIKSITTFQKQTKLRAAVGRVLKNEITEADKEGLAALFKQFDVNGDGKLSADEIAELMKSIGHSSEEAKSLLKMWDEDHDGVIDMDELKTGFASSQLGEQSKQELQQAFKRFDVDGDGFVSAQEIEKMCSLDAKETKKLIAEVDKNGDGRISFQEWLDAMKGVDVKKVDLSKDALKSK